MKVLPSVLKTMNSHRQPLRPMKLFLLLIGMPMIFLQITQVAPTFLNWLDGFTNPTIRFLARGK
jgi:hypothetical protein